LDKYFCGGATIGSKDIIENVAVCSGFQWSFIALWKYTPLITTPDKDIIALH